MVCTTLDAASELSSGGATIGWQRRHKNAAKAMRSWFHADETASAEPAT
jgi:hypothetical protein